jgi:VIT1/CCC1 family predicted Fe2+/Mn2+ transporter
MAEEMYDVLIPPGVPRTVIRDVVKKFDVQIVERNMKIAIGNMDGEERQLMAFRGKKEVVEQVEAYMLDRLREFIAEEDRK